MPVAVFSHPASVHLAAMAVFDGDLAGKVAAGDGDEVGVINVGLVLFI